MKLYFYFSQMVYVLVAVVLIAEFLSSARMSIPLFAISILLLVASIVFSLGLLDRRNRRLVQRDTPVRATSQLYETTSRLLEKAFLDFKYGRENQEKIYQALEPGEQIRIITILPGEGDSRIECAMHHAALGARMLPTILYCILGTHFLYSPLIR
jgi:hypothetical protein